MGDVETLVQLVAQGVFSVVFLVLFMAERKSHDETRKELYNVFREVAGLNRPLRRQSENDTIGTHGM